MSEAYPGPVEPTKETREKRSEKSTAETKKKLGRSVAKEVVLPPAESPRPEKVQSLWQRFGSLAEKKELDKVLLRPVERADNDSKLTLIKEDAEKAPPKSEDAEVKVDAQEEAESPADILDDEEAREAVLRYADARKELLRENAPRELPEETPPPAESAADIAFLDFVEKQLAEDAAKPIDEVLAEAEEAVTERIEQAAEESVEPEAGEQAAEHTHREGEIPLRSDIPAEGDNEATVIIQGAVQPPATPASFKGSGNSGNNLPPQPPSANGGGNVPPRVPPRIPPIGGNGNIPPYGPPPYGNGGNANVPPHYYYGAAMPPATQTAVVYNVLPRTTGITLAQVHVQERRALAQGLLLGGIIGYLIGRRRGRIKTEKKLLPIQKKLEKQVLGLQAIVLEREQKIQILAAEKAFALKTLEEKQRFAQRLSRSETLVTNTQTVESKARISQKNRAEQLGKVLVEAPLMGAGTGRNETVPGGDSLFMRKVADFTTPELKEAAEKIRIDGTSLKELWDTNRLNENAVERIVTDYIEGKSVRAALNREMMRRDIRFEQDPKGLGSNGKAGFGAGSNAATAGAALLLQNVTGQNKDAKEAVDTKQTGAKTQKPDESPLETVKEHRKQLAAAGGVVAALIAALLIIF